MHSLMVTLPRSLFNKFNYFVAINVLHKTYKYSYWNLELQLELDIIIFIFIYNFNYIYI